MAIWDIKERYDLARSNSLESQATRGIFMGGFSTDESNIVDFITITSSGNAADFGDCTQTSQNSGCGSSTRAIHICGGGPTNGGVEMDTIDYFTISSTGNAADFGNLSVARRRHCGLGNSIRGICAGGRVDPNMKNEIDFVTIATTGNATDFGDLLSASGYTAGTVLVLLEV